MRGRTASTGLLGALVPHERKVFELLDRQAETVSVAGDQLELLIHHWPNRRDVLKALAASKLDSDVAGEAVFAHVHASFVTALDREDLLGLSSAMAAAVAHMERTSGLLGAYRLPATREIPRRMAHVTGESAQHLVLAVEALRRPGEGAAAIAELRSRVHEGERLMREALPDLLADGPSTTELLAWRDVYDELERIGEAISRAARILRAIELKGG